MIKTTTAVISALLCRRLCFGTCDKTPRTVSGQLNSCMLGEIYGRPGSGKTCRRRMDGGQGEVFGICMRRLDLSGDDVNATQSLNIAASVIQSLRPASEPAAEK